MRLEILAHVCSILATLSLLQDKVFANPPLSHDQRWGNEVTGEGDGNDDAHTLSGHNQMEYKRRLLQYVFKTPEPSSEQLTINRTTQEIPYVMTKIYDLLAEREYGTEISSVDVDLIRGIPDDVGATQRMRFWFNVSAVNQSEQVIDTFFHIYKRRAMRPPGSPSGSHRIMVKLYQIVDTQSLYNADGSVGPGAVLVERQQVGAYASQWVIFKTGLKDIVKGWINDTSTNHGFLVTATDPNENHVSGAHIDFVQRGENPTTRQPVFVVYTDQEEKRSNKAKRRQRNGIDSLVNMLNEDVRQAQELEERCRMADDSEEGLIEQCTMVARSRRSRSLPNPYDDSDEEDEDGYDDTWEDNSANRGRRRSRNQNHNNRELEAERRTNSYCQLKPLYVSFAALGWERWIVAPAGINANHCDGQCPFPLTNSLSTSNHAVLQSVSNYYFPNEIKGPCCVPRKLKKMSILYYETEKVVAMRNYDDIIVESCGCR